MNVMNVEKPSVKVCILLYIREVILVKSPMNVRNVEKHLCLAHILVDISEFTLERNLINVQTVVELSVGDQT